MAGLSRRVLVRMNEKHQPLLLQGKKQLASIDLPGEKNNKNPWGSNSRLHK